MKTAIMLLALLVFMLTVKEPQWAKEAEQQNNDVREYTGENNDGSLSLPQAIKLAADEGIKTYTIGVGSQRSFLGMFMANPGVDEQGLKALADATKGQYFRADDTKGLQQIYSYIDQLEANESENRFIHETKELFYIPLLAALFMSMAMVVALRRIA